MDYVTLKLKLVAADNSKFCIVGVRDKSKTRRAIGKFRGDTISIHLVGLGNPQCHYYSRTHVQTRWERRGDTVNKPSLHQVYIDLPVDH